MTFPILPSNSPATGYNIDKSLRFRASASARLVRTFGTPTNRNIWTLSLWIKPSTIVSNTPTIIGADTSASTALNFTTNSTLEFGWSGGQLITTQVFRDPSAWYHIVVNADTTNATVTNRLKIYVNGSEVTAFTTDGRSGLGSNSLKLNSAVETHIATNPAAARYFDGYLAEVNFIDGQALTPASFGDTNALTGVWQPARYTGTYGTNGFYLDFEDTSSVAALGTDSSGNSNTWTVNNVSLTAGVTYDSMTDVPTLTSASAANYCVMNPLAGSTSFVTSNGNLTLTGVGSGSWNKTGTFAIPSGKWYWECVLTGGGGTDAGYGIFDDPNNATGAPTGMYLYLAATGNKYSSATSSAYGATWTTNDIIGIAFDSAAGSLTYYKNGVSQGVAFTGITGTYFPVVRSTNTFVHNANFGQRPFTYTPPTGFVALNTFNLPTATILAGNTVMDATLYTGNGSTQTITNAAGFQPDLVWVKNRNNVRWNILTDSVRGTNSQLFSNASNAQETRTDRLTAFNSNGFNVGSYIDVNGNADTFVGWQWQAGQGTTSSNTNGSITSTVSVNASAGFSVVTYTGNGTAGATVGHGLGVAPEMIIVKIRSAGANWYVYHASMAGGANSVMYLDATNGNTASPTVWNNTAPTSSVFSLGNAGAVNGSGSTFVAYCFASINGFSRFSGYTGNGSADGTFIYTGFRPKYVMVKAASISGNWVVHDTVRDPYNTTTQDLYPNLQNAEIATSSPSDILSNGFKLRGTGADWNASGSTYVYMAFAENPFKNSLAR